MSNPTTLVEPFSNSLGDFTGVAPTRYDSGLWVEEATTNLISNPTCVTNTTGWVTFANRSLARVTSLPAALPNELASLVTTGWGVTATNDQAALAGICSFSVSLSNVVHAFSIYAYIPTAFSASGVSLRASSFTSATGTITAAANMSLRDQWQRIEMGPFTPDAGDTSGDINLVTSGASAWLSGETIYFAAAQAEQKGHATSFVLSSLGTGYSASPSPHSRAASSAAISPTGILAPDSGALAFRVTPTIETGAEEIWGECGVKGAGTDHLRWGRDSSKHPFVEWSANDATYQRLTATETINAGQERTIVLGHDGVDISLSVNGGAVQADTRDAVSASFGAGDLTLKASAGGVIYDEFATFDRVLTNYEIARLNAAPAWSLVTLAANTQTRRIRQQFQLRSY